MTLLDRVTDVLIGHSIGHALIGAAAMAVHGVSRSTLDQEGDRIVDVVVGRQRWQGDILTRAVEFRE